MLTDNATSEINNLREATQFSKFNGEMKMPRRRPNLEDVMTETSFADFLNRTYRGGSGGRGGGGGGDTQGGPRIVVVPNKPKPDSGSNPRPPKSM